MKLFQRQTKRPRRVRRKAHHIRHNGGHIKLALLILGGALLLLIIALALRPSSQILNMPELARVQREGLLRVGVRSDMPGFADHDEGFEIALARALAARIFSDIDPDAVLDLVPVNAHTAIAKLDNNAVDIVIAMQEAQSEESYTCSAPYFHEKIVLLCRAGEERAALGNKKIGAIPKSAASLAWDSFAQKDDTAKSATLVSNFASYPDMCEALLRGIIDYIAIPATQAVNFTTPQISLHAQAVGSVGYVAISTLEEPGFAMLADVVIAELQKDGKLLEWVNQYGIGQYMAQ